MITKKEIKQRLNSDFFKNIFPPSKSDEFFEALYGDKDEGAYTIVLFLQDITKNEIKLEFQLHKRPNKCLVCSLTYGLPEVFKRHPIINVKGIIEEIKKLIPEIKIQNYTIGNTIEINEDLHIIPFTLYYSENL